MTALCDSTGATLTYRMPPLHPGQHLIRKHPARFKVVICGRRWGKTRWGVVEAVGNALQGGRAWWIAPTYKIANEGWMLIRRLANQIPGAEINKSDRVATMPGGGMAEVRSADNPDSLVGAGLTLAIFDEAADMDRAAWGESIRPSLADRKGRAIFITTPKGHGNWTYTDCWERCDTDPENWARWQMPTWTNPHIDADEIEQMRHDMSAERFAQEVEAQFVTMEGRVFPDFTRERHVREFDLEPNLPIVMGVDFGFRTFSWIMAQVDSQKRLRIFDDADWTNIQLDSVVERLKQYPWIDRVETIGCDPAGSGRSDQTGISDVEQLRAAFPSSRVVFSGDPRHRNPEWRAGRIRDLLWSIAGDSRVVVHPNAKQTIRSLELSEYPKRTSGTGEKLDPKKDGIVDHNRDALGYLIVNVLEPSSAIISSRIPWQRLNRG